jgi:hypothetical protein
MLKSSKTLGLEIKLYTALEFVDQGELMTLAQGAKQFGEDPNTRKLWN